MANAMKKLGHKLDVQSCLENYARSPISDDRLDCHTNELVQHL